jgi:hypothetical protein
MEDLQRKWNEIIKHTQDKEEVLAGLRNTIFLELNDAKTDFLNEIKSIIRIGRILFSFFRRTKAIEGKKILFYFPFSSSSNYNNLISIYRRYSESVKDVLVIHTKKLSDSNFTHPRILKEDLFKIVPFSERFYLLVPSIKLLCKLIKGKNEITGVIKLKPITYLYLILQISIYIKAGRILFKQGSIKKLISTSDFFPTDYAIYKSANIERVDTYMVQHGVFGISHFPYTSKYIFVWNKFAEERLIKMGVEADTIYISGMPSSDELFNKSTECNVSNCGKKLSLLILSDTQGRSTYPSVYQNYSDFLDKLIGLELGIDIVIKLHPAESPEFYRKYKNLVRILQRDINLYDAILQFDIIATIWSTAGLEAMALKKPTIILNVHEDVIQYAWWPEFGGGKFVHNIDEFQKILNKESLSEIIEQQNKFVRNYFFNSGHSSEFIYNILVK